MRCPSSGNGNGNRKLACIIFVATLAACNAAADDETRGETQAAPGSATGDPAVVHHPEPPPRPAEKIDSIPMEGTYEKFTMKLVEGAGEPRFSTYVPPDMIYEPVASDEGQGHYFFTNFAGKRNDNAFMLVFVFPEGATEADARRLAQAFATSRKPVQRSAEAGKKFNESIVEHDFQYQSNGGWLLGEVSVGKYNDRFFYLALQYPEDYSEGFYPRINYIRREWVWLQDGKGLGLTSRPLRE